MPLPLLDEHSATFRASHAAVWQAVRRYAHAIARSDHAVLGRILGTVPRSGFELTEEIENERVALTGRHRFARYRLVFVLDGTSDDATKLSVQSFAAFPGTRGRLYHAFLMGSRGHAFAVKHMIRTIQQDVA